LPYDLSNHAIGFTGGEESVKVYHANSSDEYWSTDHANFVDAVRESFLNSWHLWEIPSFIQGVNIFVFAPLSEFLQHQFDFGDVELTRSAKSQDVVRVEPKQLHIEDVFVADPGFCFLHCLFLLR